MNVSSTDLEGVLLFEPRVFKDDRGFFTETWNEREFDKWVPGTRFVQDNYSRSVRNTLRGLHYQITQAQGKLIRVARGEIYDVAVDLRESSPTFGKWTGDYISGENLKQLWIPEGFAHGFLVLSDEADVVYKCTDFYHPEGERTVLWNDPAIGIKWPLKSGTVPLLSAKDRQGVSIDRAERFP